MKQLITLTFALLMATPSMWAKNDEPSDTIKAINNPQNVKIIRNKNKTEVTVDIPTENGSGSFNRYHYEVCNIPNSNEPTEKLFDENEDLMFKLSLFKSSKINDKSRAGVVSKKPWKTKRYVTGMKYITWGWNFNYDSKAGIKNSFEVSVIDLIGVDWQTSRYTTLGIGIGFGFNRVLANDNSVFSCENDYLSVVEAPEDVEVEFARLDSWRIQIPLMYTQRLYKNFAIGLAGIVNFNVNSTATNRYNANHTRYTESIGGLNQRLLTADIMTTVGFTNFIGIYAKWSPIKSMEHQYGPSFRNFSIGINVNF